jgi:hypothetical protein
MGIGFGMKELFPTSHTVIPKTYNMHITMPPTTHKTVPTKFTLDARHTDT